jgi:hypothetical protein
MVKNILLLILVLSEILFEGQLYAQDLSNLKSQRPFEFDGSLHLHAGFYTTNNPISRRTPLSWAISGNPTLRFYGISIPFSFTFANQQFSYSQPFQRIGTSPSWKWIRIHAGYRNLHWSPYTLADHTFLGGGVDLSPGKFRFSAMYGYLKNIAIQSDTAISGAILLPTYQRKAYGIKLGIGSDRSHFDLIYFHAKDNPNSVQLDSAYAQIFPPKDNVVLGASLRLSLTKQLIFDVNTAASVITGNQLVGLPDIEIPTEAVVRLIQFSENFLDVNLSTRIQFAGDASLKYNGRFFGLGATFRRIDPQYNSLGAYYMQNDFENYTGNGYLRILKGRFNLSGSFGVQRNNVSGLRAFSDKRLIGSGNLSMVIGKHAGINTNYQNYYTELTPSLILTNDTLRFAQVNKTFTISPYVHFTTGKSNHNLMLSVGQQDFDNLSDGFTGSNETQGKFGMISWRTQLKEKDLTFGLTGNWNSYTFFDQDNTRYGGTLTVGKSLLDKKLQLNLSGTYNLSTLNQAPSGNIISYRINASFKILKNQSISIYTQYLSRQNLNTLSFSEWSGNIGYGIAF